MHVERLRVFQIICLDIGGHRQPTFNGKEDYRLMGRQIAGPSAPQEMGRRSRSDFLSMLDTEKNKSQKMARLSIQNAPHAAQLVARNSGTALLMGWELV